MKECVTCIYNRPIEENGWYENECTHPYRPGIKPDFVFLNGCEDYEEKDNTSGPDSVGVLCRPSSP